MLTGTRPPTISVLLPVYNGAAFLQQAVDSVLLQSYSDFELLIIDDGSTDNSSELLRNLKDPRIRVIYQENRGLAASLNILLFQAQGRYIARQDQDDVCLPERFHNQAKFLDSNSDIAIVGTAAEIWVNHARTLRKTNNPCSNSALQFNLLFDNYFVHSSIMFRRCIVQDLGGYTEEKSRQPPEDYELWSRVARQNKIANLPDVLLGYREVPNSMSRKVKNPFLKNVMKISAENITIACGSSVEPKEINSLVYIMHSSFEDMHFDISYKKSKSILERALSGVALRSGATEGELGMARKFWSKRLWIRYLDYRSGGILKKMYAYIFRKSIKKFIGELF